MLFDHLGNRIVALSLQLVFSLVFNARLFYFGSLSLQLEIYKLLFTEDSPLFISERFHRFNRGLFYLKFQGSCDLLIGELFLLCWLFGCLFDFLVGRCHFLTIFIIFGILPLLVLFVPFIQKSLVVSFGVNDIFRIFEKANRILVVSFKLIDHFHVNLLKLLPRSVIIFGLLHDFLEHFFSGLLDLGCLTIGLLFTSILLFTATKVHLVNHVLRKEAFAILTIIFVIVRLLGDVLIEVVLSAIYVKFLAFMSESHKHIIIIAIRVELVLSSLSGLLSR